MKNLIFLIIFVFNLSSCHRQNFSNKIFEPNEAMLDIYFSKQPVDYESNALKYSNLTKKNNIIDELFYLDSPKLYKIKKIDIFPKHTMNFINPYNDTLSVVFSFPKRFCLRQQNLKSYLDNFSTSMQYIIIDNGNKVRFDSIRISHETGIVPVIDCKHLRPAPSFYKRY